MTDESPHTFELVPGTLRAIVTAHHVEARDGLVPCWTYATDGLVAAGGRELAFTLLRAPGAAPDAFPRAPLALFAPFVARARCGEAPEPGDAVEVAAHAGQGDARGVAFIAAQPMAGVSLAPGSLAMLALVGREFDVARTFGATRIASRLGQRAGHFPCPPWNDPERDPVARDEEPVEAAALYAIARVRAPYASVSLVADAVTLRLPRVEAGPPALAAALAGIDPAAPFALVTPLDPSADGCLVWHPGQSEAVAIAPADGRGARVGGCFLVAAPGSAADTFNVFEDGFAARLTDASFAALRAALESGAALALRGADGVMSFALAWA